MISLQQLSLFFSQPLLLLFCETDSIEMPCVHRVVIFATGSYLLQAKLNVTFYFLILLFCKKKKKKKEKKKSILKNSNPI